MTLPAKLCLLSSVFAIVSILCLKLDISINGIGKAGLFCWIGGLVLILAVFLMLIGLIWLILAA